MRWLGVTSGGKGGAASSPLSPWAVVVFFAVMMYALGGALTNGMYADLTQEVGNVQVHTEGYRDARNFGDSFG